MKIRLFILPGILFAATLFISCEKHLTVVENQEELITSLFIKLIPDDGGKEVTLGFIDPDGIGGVGPMIISDTLMAGKTYNAEIKLLNEVITPPINITEEIKSEGTDHQFFYEPSASLAANLKIIYNDADLNNKPIGILTKVKTFEKGTGTLLITLRHQPDKNGAGVIEGNINNAGGETDIEISFDIVIN